MQFHVIRDALSEKLFQLFLFFLFRVIFIFISLPTSHIFRELFVAPVELLDEARPSWNIIEDEESRAGLSNAEKELISVVISQLVTDSPALSHA